MVISEYDQLLRLCPFLQGLCLTNQKMTEFYLTDSLVTDFTQNWFELCDCVNCVNNQGLCG